MKTTVILACAVLAVYACPAAGQATESRDVRLREECRLAGQILRDGHPAVRRTWALGTIDLCPSGGPVVLADLWSRRPADPVVLEELVVPSARLWDRRLADALRSVALDADAPDGTRVSALSVLAGYAAPNVSLRFADLIDPRPDTLVQVTTFTAADVPHTVGDAPLPATFRTEVVALLRGLENDPSRVVASASRRLRRFVLRAP